MSAGLEQVAVGLTPNELVFANQYLEHFGYAEEAKAVDQQIKDFQLLFGIEVDGVLGPKTINAMVLTPRCGLPDVQMNRDGKAYWGLKKLTYTWVGQKVHQDQDDIFQKAWNNWSEVCDLKFERINDPQTANIVMRGGNRRQDGLGTPGNVLAYAYLPNSSGFTGQLEMVIDFAETWIPYGASSAGTELENVVTHEGGHNLGLDHSKGLMAPYYKRGLNKPQEVDDRPRIIDLYGEPAALPPLPPVGEGLSLNIVDGKIVGTPKLPGHRVTKLPV